MVSALGGARVARTMGQRSGPVEESSARAVASRTFAAAGPVSSSALAKLAER